MANRAYPLAAIATALILAFLTLGSAVVVASQASTWALGPADWAALRFTVEQAALSAGISGFLAIPVARALARRSFVGRGTLIRLMAAPFLLPVVVAVLGLLAVFGRAGPVNQALSGLGLPPISIFGLHGVVLAHVFLNLPLAVRMILMGWQSIPAERFRLARSLGLSGSSVFRHLELPMLRAVLPGIVSVIFLLCLTSFAIALTLGGGPAASTLELAIYQSLRFEFDLGRAAMLAGVQFLLCALVAVSTGWFTLPLDFGTGLDRGIAMIAPGGVRRLADGVVILLAAALLLVPLLAVVMRGLSGLGDLPATLWPAAGRSVAIAVGSALLSAAAALTLAIASAPRANRWAELSAMLPLATSGLVLGTGLFLVVHPVLSPEKLAVPVTVLVNAVLALPFIFRLLMPEARQLHADYGRLCQSLGLTGVTRLRWVTLPRLARPLGFGTGLAAALSMGDLGVIALFAGDQGATLPLLVQRLMGAYRMDAAAGAALVLVAFSFLLFWLFDWIGSRNAAT